MIPLEPSLEPWHATNSDWNLAFYRSMTAGAPEENGQERAVDLCHEVKVCSGCVFVYGLGSGCDLIFTEQWLEGFDGFLYWWKPTWYLWFARCWQYDHFVVCHLLNDLNAPCKNRRVFSTEYASFKGYPPTRIIIKMIKDHCLLTMHEQMDLHQMTDCQGRRRRRRSKGRGAQTICLLSIFGIFWP